MIAVRANAAKLEKRRKAAALQHIEMLHIEKKAQDPQEPVSGDTYSDPDEWVDYPRAEAYLLGICVLRRFTFSHTFDVFILSIILIACILVGIQTDPTLENHPAVLAVDLGVLIVFLIEFAMKVLSEGFAPVRYFIGKDWRWNLFDFAIIAATIEEEFIQLTSSSVGGSVAILRTMRLLRLAKLIKRVPQLNMIVGGFIGGVKAIAYILLLLFLVFYLYAIIGNLAFVENDPWHFGSVDIALVSLFRVATLDRWMDLFYINWFGCDSFSESEYFNPPEWVPENEYLWCTSPIRQPVLTTFFWFSFVTFSSMIMINLFIGAVTMSMADSMESMKEEQTLKRRETIKKQRTLALKKSVSLADRHNRKFTRKKTLMSRESVVEQLHFVDNWRTRLKRRFKGYWDDLMEVSETPVNFGVAKFDAQSRSAF